jgi:hypothetical protein
MIAPVLASSDAGTGDARIWLDGVELGDAALSGLMYNPPLSAVTIGSETYSSSPVTPVDIWFDEVIVDDKPIGCGK